MTYTFAFIVIMAGLNGEPNQDYVMDYNLTFEDCGQRIESYAETANAMGYLMSCAPETPVFADTFGWESN